LLVTTQAKSVGGSPEESNSTQSAERKFQKSETKISLERDEPGKSSARDGDDEPNVLDQNDKRGLAQLESTGNLSVASVDLVSVSVYRGTIFSSLGENATETPVDHGTVLKVLDYTGSWAEIEVIDSGDNGNGYIQTKGGQVYDL